MKRAIALAAVLVWALPAAAQKPSPRPSLDRAEAAAGEVIYLRYCAACHGRSLKGDGPVASGLVATPPDLTTLAARNGGSFPYEKVAAIIDGRETSRTHGTPDMPVWGEVFAVSAGTEAPSAAAAVRRITHFVWSRQAKTSPAAPAKSK